MTASCLRRWGREADGEEEGGGEGGGEGVSIRVCAEGLEFSHVWQEGKRVAEAKPATAPRMTPKQGACGAVNEKGNGCCGRQPMAPCESR